MNWKYILIVFVLAAVVGGGVLRLSQEQEISSVELLRWQKVKEPKSLNNIQQFRNLTVKFVRAVAENYFDKQLIQPPGELGISGNWELFVTVYHQGEIKGVGEGKNEVLSSALKEAAGTALGDKRLENLTKKDLGDVRFLVKFLYPPDHFSFVEYNGEGKELIGDVAAIRYLDKELILEKIEQGKEFLYKVMHEEEHGFYKKYDTLNDSFENRLHTVYSASIIYTFLYIYDLEKDAKILEQLSDWGDFLLSMQNRDKEDERYGAFHYSFYLDSKEKEKRFVAGTAALSTFTLVRMYDFTGDPKYLESAVLAGDWLTTMQKPNGSMKAQVKYSNEEWVYEEKESLLYNGQVLSALSKLYGKTKDRKYLETAERIAQYFTEKYEKEQGFIQGEYREKNPISNSWVVMSLMDFYRINPDDYYKSIIFEVAEKVLEKQKNDPGDLSHFGSWWKVYSTSGVGWISEVMVETYRFCKEQGKEDCDKYKDAAIKAMRLLSQNTYSEENTYFLRNPEKAVGGVFWNQENKYVRTDSVCHALNGYLRIMNDLGEDSLLSIPEEPFEATLNELKK